MTIVVAALLYLRFLTQATPGLGWWAAAFGVSVLRHLVEVFGVHVHIGVPGLASDVLAAASAVCLLAGAFVFLGRRLNFAWLVGAWAVASAGAGLAMRYYGSWEAGTVLAMFVGLAAFYTGAAFVRSPSPFAPGYRLVAASFMLWGAHRLVEPLFVQKAGYLHWNILIDEGLAITIGIALIIMVLRSLQQRARVSEAEARAAHSRLESIIDANPVPLMIGRFEDDSVIFTNRRAAESLGLDAETVMGRRLAPYFDQPQEYRQLIHRLKREGRIDGFVMRMRRADGALFWGLVSLRPITFAGEHAVLISYTDITERKSMEEELHRLATTDPLTGILDRRRYLELSARELKRAARYAKDVSIIMIDIDHFKSVNDNYGHAVGDEVLRGFADSCRAMLRGQDLFGRLGGEEFALTLPETNAKEAREVADRLRQVVRDQPVWVDSQEVRFTVSIGITQGIVTDDMDTALRRADKAMYLAKSRGRDRVELATAGDAQA